MQKGNLGVQRSKRDKNYHTVGLNCVEDTRLSWKAKGAHFYLISRPRDWTVNSGDLRQRSTDGEDSLRSGIEELLKLGYLYRMVRRNEKKQWMDIGYYVMEEPQSFEQATDLIKAFGWEIDRRGISETSDREAGNPRTGNPREREIPENGETGGHNNNKIFNNKKIITNIPDSKESEGFQPSTEPEQPSKQVEPEMEANIVEENLVVKEEETSTKIVINLDNTRPIKLSPFRTYTNIAKNIFLYWNTKPELPHHRIDPESKSFKNALVEIDRFINKGCAEEEFKTSIDNYCWLLNLDHLLLKKSTTGTIVGLCDFIKFSKSALVRIDQYNKNLVGMKSWFVECLKTREELEQKWSKLEKDLYPNETACLKKLWKEYTDRKVQSVDDENIFRRISIKAHNYFESIRGKYNFGMFERNVETKLHYLFEALQEKGQDWRTCRPHFLNSDRMFTEILPAHWERIALAETANIDWTRRITDEERNIQSCLYPDNKPRETREELLARIAATNNPGEKMRLFDRLPVDESDEDLD